MAQPHRTLGVRLKEARLRRKMSQEDVAEAIGIHAMTISKYERDAQDPHTKTLAALAKVLDVSTDWLLTEHEDFMHPGLKSQENVMPLALSFPNLSLRIRKGALSDESIEFIEEVVVFFNQRESDRRDAEGMQESKPTSC